MSTINQVAEFHAAFDCVTSNTPYIPRAPSTDAELRGASNELMRIRGTLRKQAPNDLRAQRVALIVEELAELALALAERDIVGSLDALVDLRYVCDGGVLNLGLQNVFHRAFERVHESNMSKLGADGKPIHDAAGKVVKGPAYTPPHLTDLVL